jgi:phage terminase large subunit-like protein
MSKADVMAHYFPGKKRATRKDKKTAAQLDARGSFRAKEREQEERGGVREPASFRRALPPSVHVSAVNRRLLDLLPGYSPFAAAGKRGRTKLGVWHFKEFDFHPSRACRAINWIEQRCTHIRGQRGPFVLSPIERCIVANLFGWLRKDGTRRYRKCLIYVARKFGKTLLTAAILLYLLLEDGEYGAEVYCAASRREQAKLLWAPAKGMIRNDRYLSSRFKLYQHSIVVLDPDTGEPGDSYFQAICAEAHAAHGYNPFAYAVDEVHTQKDGELSDTLETGTASRLQPVAIFVTTAPHAGDTFCGDIYKYACGVRDGTIEDPHYLPCVFEMTEDDDWRSEKAWMKANPHYPVTPTRDYMESRCKLAEQSPRFLSNFLRHNCNRQTAAEVQWFNIETWDRGAGAIDLDALRGRPCYGGLDLSSKLDLTSFVLVFPEDGHAVLPFFWAPRATALRRDEKGVRPSYTRWAQDGHLALCNGASIDQEMIRRKILELSVLYDIRGVGVDRWQADKLAKELEETDGVCEFFPVGMGYASMSGPCKYLELLVVDQGLAHGGHPILRWNASTVMAETDNSPAENIKPTKPKSRTGARQLDDNKIDGIVALAMGLAVYLAADVDTGPSAYEERGVLTL